MLLHTQLQKHHAQSCFHQVHSVQQGMKKTITDMQNSITPWGWYHYCTAPQGYISSDNGYTRRFDDIAETFLRVSKWWTMHFSCCLMTWSLWQKWFYPNFKNFVFGADTVAFSGFEIRPNFVCPSINIFKAVLDFPVPRSIMNVCSWFGLIKSPMLLSCFYPKHHFIGMTRCNYCLKITKNHRRSWEWCVYFRQTKINLLNYWLVQKRHRLLVVPETPFMKEHFCCQSGWKVILCGSWLHPGESCYVPIKVEALTVADVLDKAITLYWVAKIRSLLSTINCSRGFSLIDLLTIFLTIIWELCYRFTVVHIPGQKNKVIDSLSWHPSGTITSDITASRWYCCTHMHFSTRIVTCSSSSIAHNIWCSLQLQEPTWKRQSLVPLLQFPPFTQSYWTWQRLHFNWW